MEKLNEIGFMFGDNFSCDVIDGKVFIEQYGEGSEELEHIKTKDDYIKLYEILTGDKYEY